MAKIDITDVLATSYFEAKAPPEITQKNAALLLIDIQHLATPEYLHNKAIKGGLSSIDVKEALADYTVRFEAAVEECRNVLCAARANNIPPIHVKIQSASADARDTGPVHRRLGWEFPPSNEATKFLDAARPLEGEIVITKTASGAFTGTSLDTVLRNMGIQHLYICGFVTDECVETTARVALDLGYVSKIIRDATTTYQASSYQNVIEKFEAFGFTQRADEVRTIFESVGKDEPQTL